MKYRILGLLLVPLFTLSGPASGQESSALFLKTHIPLPNVNGRIDHLGDRRICRGKATSKTNRGNRGPWVSGL
jgi:hypothetical protein